MALSKIDVANMLTGATPVANGGTGLASGTSGQFLKFTGSTTLASAAGGGITHAQKWRLNTGFTGDADPITSNLEAVDSDGYGSLGSAMTVSSGIFTFPTTGIWLIQMTVQFHVNASSRTNQLIINTTTDGSSFGQASKNDAGIAHSQNSHTYNTGTNDFIFDVTNVSTHKVSFSTNVNDDSGTTAGETNVNRTHFTFIRLGDT